MLPKMYVINFSLAFSWVQIFSPVVHILTFFFRYMDREIRDESDREFALHAGSDSQVIHNNPNDT
jgi:hypothetical protein